MANVTDTPPTGSWSRRTVVNFIASAAQWGGAPWGLFAWGEKNPNPKWTRKKL